MTKDEQIEALARELERHDMNEYGCGKSWTDEQHDIWWFKDRAAEDHRKKQRARAKFAIEFLNKK